jgi:ABC-type transport system involved in multi-copper enzyme maturation permease subunit
MLRVVRCELARLRAPSVLLLGTGLMALFAFLATIIVVYTASGGSGMAPPGADRVTLAMLEAPDGMFVAVENFVGMLGIVALSIWGMSAASDYSTGLIRLLVQAEPDRVRLLGGKVVALTVFTCLSTFIMTVGVAAVAPVLAEANGVDAQAWSQDTVVTILHAYGRITLSVLLWGVVGLFVGVITRSSGAAIAIGVGYLLAFEGLIGMVLDSGSVWLPGGAFSVIATGGSADMSFGAALLIAAAYAVSALAISAVVFRRRDITA